MIECGPVPDALFPSDNAWDIPLLDLRRQARHVTVPLVKWGFFKRSQRMDGTYHFYAEDYKFEALWKDPAPVVRSGCSAVVEPNFSTNEQMPRAIALHSIYRKRWLARYWQACGLDIWVDLCVAVRHADLNLLGVPRGWGSYMTRGYADQLQTLEAEYEIAQEHCGETEELRFVTYGGGHFVRAWCEARGLLHVPEHMHVFDGRLLKPASIARNE